LLPSVYANAHGAITGLANLYPRTIRALWDISLSTLPTASVPCTPELLSQAQQLQGIVARADRTIAVTGIAGTKWLMARRVGYGGVCRKPLGVMADADGEKLRKHAHVVDIEEMEALLEAEAKGTVENKTAIKKLVNGGISSYLTNGHTANGIPVSRSDSTAHTSSSSHSSSSHPITPSTDSPSASPTSLRAHHKRDSTSLKTGVRSLIGSLRGKRTSTAA
jgi:hypothetical protein